MRQTWRLVVGAVMLCAFIAITPNNSVRAGGTVRDGSPGSCTEQALDTALAGSGEVTFDCHDDDRTILLSSSKTITTDTRIVGSGEITLEHEEGFDRIFSVEAGVTLELDGLTLTGGVCANDGGGAVYNEGALEITNSTLSDNIADNRGGALYNTAPAKIINSTINGNSAPVGGGIYNEGSITLQNTLIANSVSGDNCAGPDGITSLGHNLSDDASCSLSGSGDLDNTDADLTPLGNYGGPTFAHLP